MGDQARIVFSAIRVLGRSVAVYARREWYRAINASGEPTILASAPYPTAAVAHHAAVVAIAGSGIENPDPGLDVVRYDAHDWPKVINIDHYTVIENLPAHPQFTSILSMARVGGSPELEDLLRDTCSSWVLP